MWISLSLLINQHDIIYSYIQYIFILRFLLDLQISNYVKKTIPNKFCKMFLFVTYYTDNKVPKKKKKS